MDQPFGTGGIPSPHDYRDGIAAAAAQPVQLQPLVETDLSMFPVLMQGHIPACVSHAWVLIMQLYWYRKTGKIINFSPRFLHILSNDFNATPEDGRYPRTVAKVSATIGCCTTDTLPNDVTLDGAAYMDPSVITQAMRDEAAQYKLPGYIRIGDDSVIDFRAGVTLYEAISGLFEIGAEWWTPDWTPATVDPLKIPAHPVGGHEVVVKGYDIAKGLNTIRNSWSDQWGEKGETHYDPVAWLPYIIEAWAPAEIPQDVKNFLAQLPSPTNFHYTFSQNLRQGDFNADVKFAQIALMILGFLGPINPDDLGHYGPKTAAAVGAYQKAHRIAPVPGSIGPQTRAALNAQFAL